ncbi:MAG: hypothetical protein JXR68_03535 [Bacteroidales bacterium]|nr:hypothetical protein [Bacteroidales bacterium]
MIKKVLIILGFIGFVVSANAQIQVTYPQRGKNAIYTDAFILIFYNSFQINYERTLLSSNNLELNARIGAGLWTNWGFSDIAFPSDLHLIYTKHVVQPEVFGGIISFYDNDTQIFDSPRLTIGGAIRIQPYKYGFFFRIKGLYTSYPAYEFMPALGIGWNF